MKSYGRSNGEWQAVGLETVAHTQDPTVDGGAAVRGWSFATIWAELRNCWRVAWLISFQTFSGQSWCSNQRWFNSAWTRVVGSRGLLQQFGSGGFDWGWTRAETGVAIGFCIVPLTGIQMQYNQFICGAVLHDGSIQEMKTGEGKTLVST
ncbi:hypothetical protein CASFOL_042394 [Castilleja foliolosa]|uniref:SecA DEAD-like N-terminal domain-containing protein n=1 Tax=Castilleja foliolosa TaxID=1961234 RepID=A0ABD3BBU9_9LAMI